MLHCGPGMTRGQAQPRAGMLDQFVEVVCNGEVSSCRGKDLAHKGSK
jgi:hypothetical protein